jgi:uncharacterized membrane protein
MENSRNRFSAFIAYLLPVIGWVYAIFTQRKNAFVMFHTKQAIGLVGFILAVFATWVAVGYVFAYIPYLFLVSVILFTLVIAAYIYAFIAWLSGMLSALRGQVKLLPLFGRYANNLPL